MMLQTKAANRLGQDCRLLGAASLALLGACGGEDRVAIAASLPAVRSEVAPQLLSVDPCSWLSAGEVSAALGRALRGVPVRVASAESITPSSSGAACMYELEPARGKTPGVVSLELKMDGAELQAELASSAARSYSAAEATWSATWDWVSTLPAALFAARQGHVGILLVISDAVLSPMDVEPLAASLLSKIPDAPFTEAASDPRAAGKSPDPCALITRQEAEAVLGELRFAPFRSAESTPVAHGAGSSCTYYSAGHHVLVLTPSWRDGKKLFGLMRGMARLTPQSGDDATPASEPWDDRAMRAAGKQYYLKGDLMLELHVGASLANETAALHLARVALGRMRPPNKLTSTSNIP